jgi:hypothetical protein
MGSLVPNVIYCQTRYRADRTRTIVSIDSRFVSSKPQFHRTDNYAFCCVILCHLQIPLTCLVPWLLTLFALVLVVPQPIQLWFPKHHTTVCERQGRPKFSKQPSAWSIHDPFGIKVIRLSFWQDASVRFFPNYSIPSAKQQLLVSCQKHDSKHNILCKSNGQPILRALSFWTGQKNQSTGTGNTPDNYLWLAPFNPTPRA